MAKVVRNVSQLGAKVKTATRSTAPKIQKRSKLREDKEKDIAPDILEINEETGKETLIILK